MQQLPEQVACLSAEAYEAWRRFGEWLSARYGEIRVNSVGHLVVPSTENRPAFMLGVGDTEHGALADLHSPFLVQVPGDPQMIELVGMNVNLASLGAVRIIPEDQDGSRYALELRHQVHVTPAHAGVALLLRRPCSSSQRRPIRHATTGGRWDACTLGLAQRERNLSSPRWLAFFLLVALGLIVVVSLTPSLDGGDWGRRRMASFTLILEPFRRLVSINEASLNVALFVPLAWGAQMIDRRRPRAVLSVAVLVLPPAVELIQYAPPGARPQRLADERRRDPPVLFQ